MTSVKIMLNSIGYVNGFVNTVTGFDTDMKLVHDKYVINAKSILGIFSLDLLQPIELQIYADLKEAEPILEQLKEYLA